MSPVARLMGIFLIVGITALYAGYRVDFARADAHPFWGYLTRPYRFLDARWAGGGRQRYFRQIGWAFTAISGVVLLGIFLRSLRG